MQKFNKEIQITVSVDSIAEELLNHFDKEFKHAESVTEALIGRMVAKDEGGLSRLYNALKGYKNEINFKVGDNIKVKNLNVYGYWTPESVEKRDSVRQAVEIATVSEIDIHSDTPIKLSFLVPQIDGKMQEKYEWVKMSQCTEVPAV